MVVVLFSATWTVAGRPAAAAATFETQGVRTIEVNLLSRIDPVPARGDRRCVLYLARCLLLWETKKVIVSCSLLLCWCSVVDGLNKYTEIFIEFVFRI